LQNQTYTHVTTLSEKHIPQLQALYKREWWTMDRAEADIRLMLKNSDLVLGLLDQKENLVGFARVLTDFVFKALILDVIVDPDHRNRQLGLRLMNLLAAELSGVNHLELYCLPQMIPFYQRWGFTEKLGDLTFMRAEVT